MSSPRNTVVRTLSVIILAFSFFKIITSLSYDSEFSDVPNIPYIFSVINKIQEFVGAPLPIIRIMPNTPVSVGCGVIPYCCNTLVEENVLTDFLADMRFSGLWDAIPEHLMDAVSALSGSGPAYLYLMLEAMADGAVSCGIPRNKALLYAANTMLGAAKMQLETGEHPGVLKDAVCSPGGSTIAGIKALEEHGFRGAVIDCLISAYNRNQELGK